MRNLSLYKCKSCCICRHLQSHICTKVPFTSYFIQSRRTNVACSKNIISNWFEDQIFFLLLAAHNCCCIHNGVNQRFVSCTTAYVSVFLEPVTNLFSCWRRILFQKNFCRHNKSRRTETTLCTSMSHPCYLQRVQIVNGSDTFNGLDHCFVFYFFHFYDTGTNSFAIHDNGTGTTLTLSTTYFTSGKI